MIDKSTIGLILDVIGILVAIFGIKVTINIIPISISYMLIAAIILIVLWLFWRNRLTLKNIIKNMILNWNRNKIIRNRFRTFKKLVDRFELFQAPNYKTYREDAFHHIIEKLREIDGFKDMLKVPISRIQPTFNLFTIRFNCFNRRLCILLTSKCFDEFSQIFREFENILGMYYELIITPLIEIIEEKSYERVPDDIKRMFKTITDDYLRFLNEYIEFGENIENEFKESDRSHIPIFCTYANMYEMRKKLTEFRELVFRY